MNRVRIEVGVSDELHGKLARAKDLLRIQTAKIATLSEGARSPSRNWPRGGEDKAENIELRCSACHALEHWNEAATHRTSANPGVR